MSVKRVGFIITFITSVMLCSTSVFSQDKIRAAVAANFIKPFNEIALSFEKQSGIKVEATFSSTGNLYSQITNGAPYDIFLSADEERPAKLYKDGLTGAVFVYAKGEVILWSLKKDFCRSKDWKDAIKKDDIKKLAIANPATAPYGLAAETALKKTELLETVKSKLVNSQDIAMAFQYSSTGAVDAGFCAMSAANSGEGKKGCYYRVKEAPEIIQSACVLKKSENITAAEKFAKFLGSPEALKIKKKYGYK